MIITKVRVDGQTFFLDPAEDLIHLKSSIVDAVREGSDFVDFRTVGHGLVSILVTPRLPVRFEMVERSEEKLEEMQNDPPPLDDEWWFRYGI